MLQTVLSMARLTYNGTKAWKPHLKRAFDSDTLLASLSATARSLIHVTSATRALLGSYAMSSFLQGAQLTTFLLRAIK